MTKTVALLVVVVGLLLVACYSDNQQPGVLQGNMTIGPIWPVEPPGEKPPIPPEVYEARKVMVYDRHKTKLVMKVDLGQDGYYRVELKPGIYIIDINYVGVDSSSDVPKEVKIRPGETVEVNIDIDTGIR